MISVVCFDLARWLHGYNTSLTDTSWILGYITDELLLLHALQWRHNEHHGVSNHQPRDCLLNRLFSRRSKKTSKLRVTGLCAGNSPVTDEFPTQMASNAEKVSIWWRHHDNFRWSLSHRVHHTIKLHCMKLWHAADQVTDRWLNQWWLGSLTHKSPGINGLTHWGRDKMAAISQTTLSSAFSWEKMSEFQLKFHWTLFPRVQLTTFQHCFS